MIPSTYGFLKNQRFFEAFLFLAFLAKGLDFFQIGLLVAFRSLAVNVLEVPSGAIADVFGRRRVLVVSLSAYLAGFVVLGAADHLALLAAGVRPGDEVLVSTLSFIAPANAVRYVGAWPVFMDADPVPSRNGQRVPGHQLGFFRRVLR